LVIRSEAYVPPRPQFAGKVIQGMIEVKLGAALAVKAADLI
jgi:hypothetical protein